MYSPFPHFPYLSHFHISIFACVDQTKIVIGSISGLQHSLPGSQRCFVCARFLSKPNCLRSNEKRKGHFAAKIPLLKMNSFKFFGNVSGGFIAPFVPGKRPSSLSEERNFRALKIAFR